MAFCTDGLALYVLRGHRWRFWQIQDLDRSWPKTKSIYQYQEAETASDVSITSIMLTLSSKPSVHEVSCDGRRT